MNNLYWIKDDKGNRIKFKPNWAQKVLLDNLWFLNVILKVRQVGITTFFCILYLDDVLFNGLDAGLIAHTLQDAIKIFDSKIKYGWDNLPETLKKEYKVDTDNTRELKFKRGKTESSIYVGTSLRSGTVQRLHLSELGTIDQKYPNKSEEIKSGALNTVHKGQIVTIESTAKGQVGVFYNLCKQAMDNEKMGRPLSEMDWKFFFFPWWKHPEYQLEGYFPIPKEMQEYFEKIQKSEGMVLSQPKKNWYYKKWRTQEDSMKSEYPSTPTEAFQLSIEGAYYGKQMDRIMENGQIMSVPYEPSLPVDVWWDLGIAKKKTDAMSLGFTQDVGLEIHFIDYYANCGEGLAHYINVIREKEYVYGKFWAPHDIKVKELVSGKTRLESAARLGLHFSLVENMGFNDGVEAVRRILSKCWFDEEKTAKLVIALKAYRHAWDDNLGKFRDEPLKDWTTDPCDMVRMMAVGHRDHTTLGDYDPEIEELRRIKQYQENKTDPSNVFPEL